jgi:four helix bundle protein
MKDFRSLMVWEKAHTLTLAAYQITTSFPKSELYGLTSQIRRCSSSIPSNIAEGCGRRGNAELHRFLQIASGSGSELEYQLLLARDLHYLNDAEYQRLSDMPVEVRRMLTSLIRKVDHERSLAKC